MSMVKEGNILWEPSLSKKNDSNIYYYMKWLKINKGLGFENYDELWRWSITNLEEFWESIWEYFDIRSSQKYTSVLEGRKMPNVRWFTQAKINYAEHVFLHLQKRLNKPAIIFKNETEPIQTISWGELYEQVASVAQALRKMGVKKGDRVVAYLPNIPQTVIAFLATASIGGVWSSCPPEFGVAGIIDRFKQIEPKVLFAVDGYYYNGKYHDKRPIIKELKKELPTLEHIVVVPYTHLNENPESYWNWSNLLQNKMSTIQYEDVPFDHPLWILYSSGTTGLPKPIVHSQGGILLEHLKVLHLQCDLKEGDRFFWSTTTGWMMWNFLVGGLLVGTTILLYDGNPGYPNMESLWKFADETKMTFFGTSAAYLITCMKSKLIPKDRFSLASLKGIGSTGSPLPPEGFSWIYEAVKNDIWVASISGGTDVCTAFVGGCPILPVRAGEIQCRCLGVKVECFNEKGESVLNEVGELVVTQPMPSMPIYFWNDLGNRRYLSSYFDYFPGVWKHGDWIKITHEGGIYIYGRSDSTINRMGIRIGTSEIYRAVEDIDDVVESLVFDVDKGARTYILLFVVLKDGITLEESLKKYIKSKIRTDLSPRHVPDEIYQVSGIPKTLNGKKMEVPLKRIFKGTSIKDAINMDAMSNPEVLEEYLRLASKLTHKNNGDS